MAERLETKLEGVVLIEPAVHGDERGFFQETFRADAWAAEGVATDFVQDNHSRSRRGVVRGIHFQTEPGQAKLVRCARGEILDVAVDLRRGSPTYGQWEAQVHFAEGLERTVAWYRDNEEWWGPIRSGEYREYYEKQYGRALGG